MADTLTAQLQQQWERWLDEAIREFAPDAPASAVVTADRLAHWCEQYPSLVRRLRPDLLSAWHLDEWTRQECGIAPTYVTVQAWAEPTERVRRHADLAQPAGSPVLAISGEAGVGKTRLVLEAVRGLAGSRAVLLYTDRQEEADRLIELLARDPSAQAVLVADECSVPTRVRMQQQIGLHANRLRVLAIDNESTEPTPSGDELRLSQPDAQAVEAILVANFPDVPMQQRYAISHLAGGSVRLALDVCRHLPRLGPDGVTDSLATELRDRYLRRRLSEDHLRVVQLLGLVARVQRVETDQDDLAGLCRAVPASALTPAHVRAVAHQLRQAPGFVAVSSEHLFVNPRLIAQAAFRSGWDRWVGPDVAGFLSRLPDQLEDAFLRQVRDCGSEPVRRAVVARYPGMLRHLRPADLRADAIPQIVRLVEIEPSSVGPRLVELVEALSADALRSLDGRRSLVELGRRLLGCREHFALAERLLHSLALAESENYSNNSTVIWATIFRPLLSGSPIPFAERLRRLEQRFLTTTAPDELRLCLAALDGPLRADQPFTGQALSPALVLGRLPVPDWVPTTWEEHRNTWSLTAELVHGLASSANPATREGVIDRVIEHCVGLIHAGHLDAVMSVVESAPMTDRRLARVVDRIGDILAIWCWPEERHMPEDMEAELRAWRSRLIPAGLHGRLVSVVGQNDWDVYQRWPDHGEPVLGDLARELLATDGALDAELPWLSSEEAKTGFRFGAHVGRIAPAELLTPIVASAVAGNSTLFAKGFLSQSTLR